MPSRRERVRWDEPKRRTPPVKSLAPESAVGAIGTHAKYDGGPRQMCNGWRFRTKLGPGCSGLGVSA